MWECRRSACGNEADTLSSCTARYTGSRHDGRNAYRIGRDAAYSSAELRLPVRPELPPPS